MNYLKPTIWFVALALAAVSFGCDGSKVVRHGPNSGGGNNGTNNGGGQLTEEGTDDAGHGPDEDVQLAEAGFMTGSWRVGDAADNALIANFDLIQEEGKTAVEGYYTMGSALYTRLEGKSGDVGPSSSFDGQTLTLKWNPTDVASEMYTVTAEKQDRDTFTGRISAIDYEELDREVVITRYNVPIESGGDDETAGDIDAGSQGGAGE